MDELLKAQFEIVNVQINHVAQTLEKIEKRLDKTEEVTIAIGSLLTCVDTLQKQNEELFKRVNQLELKPVKRLDLLTTAVISAVISLIGGIINGIQ